MKQKYKGGVHGLPSPSNFPWGFFFFFSFSVILHYFCGQVAELSRVRAQVVHTLLHVISSPRGDLTCGESCLISCQLSPLWSDSRSLVPLCVPDFQVISVMALKMTCKTSLTPNFPLLENFALSALHMRSATQNGESRIRHPRTQEMIGYPHALEGHHL